MKGYQPIDPKSIHASDTLSKKDLQEVLKKFPNDAARIAIGKLNRNGSLVFSPISISRKGQSYSVIIDYVKYINTTIPARYAFSQKIFTDKELKDAGFVALDSGNKDNLTDIEINHSVVINKHALKTNFGDIQSASTDKYSNILAESENDYSHEIRIPVYIGVGLRVHASVTASKDSLNIGSLFGLGVAASQNEITGSLIIQTLGISGKEISQLMPISEQINQSTIQNAMQAIATMKSKLYDAETDIFPQVIGFNLPYNIEGAKDLIESTIHSEVPRLIVNKNFNISFEQEQLN